MRTCSVSGGSNLRFAGVWAFQAALWLVSSTRLAVADACFLGFSLAIKLRRHFDRGVFTLPHADAPWARPLPPGRRQPMTSLTTSSRARDYIFFALHDLGHHFARANGLGLGLRRDPFLGLCRGRPPISGGDGEPLSWRRRGTRS